MYNNLQFEDNINVEVYSTEKGVDLSMPF